MFFCCCCRVTSFLKVCGEISYVFLKSTLWGVSVVLVDERLFNWLCAKAHNLVPSVLSLLRESTLAAACHLSARFLQIAEKWLKVGAGKLNFVKACLLSLVGSGICNPPVVFLPPAFMEQIFAFLLFLRPGFLSKFCPRRLIKASMIDNRSYAPSMSILRTHKVTSSQMAW